MKNISLLTIVSFVLLFSCKKSEYKEYEGSWRGTYTGDDYGTWSVSVDDDGKVSGTARSDSFTGFPFDVNGTVSKNGEFDAEAVTFFSTITFTGNLNSSVASGNWISTQDSLSGTWSGHKD